MKSYALLALSLCSTIWSVGAQNASTVPVVDLGYSKYQGFYNATSNVTGFLGIRFAAPPVGDLRWRAPQPPIGNGKTYNATVQPPKCPQALGGTLDFNQFATKVRRDLKSTGGDVNGTNIVVNGTNPDVNGTNTNVNGTSTNVNGTSTNVNGTNTATNGTTTDVNGTNTDVNGTISDPDFPRFPEVTEDCLFLNVFVPNDVDPDKSLPVVVYFHGGGYSQGWAEIFHGDDLVVNSGHNVISVVFQFRLGVFGYLAGAGVKANGDLNAGLLDQEFALKWVQSYISRFGGDPDQVTIWGESSGAGSVLEQIVAHGGNTQPPLFRGAMTSSTFHTSQFHYSSRIPETIFSQVVNLTGCLSAQDQMSCLRAAPSSLLQTVNSNISTAGLYGIYSFLPVVDGSFIVERPSKTLAKGHANGEYLLAVTNTNEGLTFVHQEAITDFRYYITQLFPIAPTNVINKIVRTYKSLYTILGFGATPGEMAVTADGEANFICSTYYLLKAFSGRAWKGEFALLPAQHEQDVAYYFYPSYLPFTPNAPPMYNNTDFRKAFAQSFFSVIQSNDPNIKYDPTNVRPDWPKWSLSNQTEMLFNKTETGVPVIHTKPTDSGLFERCDYWQSIGGFIAQ